MVILGLEITPQFREIEHFSVVNNPISAVGRGHRLVAGGAQIQDTEPSINDGDRPGGLKYRDIRREP